MRQEINQKTENLDKSILEISGKPSSSFGVLDVANYDYKKNGVARTSAYAIRVILEAVRDHVNLSAVMRCFPYLTSFPWPQLAQERFQAGTVYFERCRNKNACPVCTRAHIAEQRREFSYEFDAFIAAGYKPYWQTFESGFAQRLDGRGRRKAMAKLWRELTQNGKYSSTIKKLRVVNLKVCEFTISQGFWTPHFHVVWLFPPEVSEREIQDFWLLVNSIWRRRQSKNKDCVSLGGSLFNSQVDGKSTRTFAHYLFKSFYLEMSNGMVVIPSSPKTPFDYLVRFAFSGDLDDLEKWHAYEELSSNNRSFKFSKQWKTEADKLMP